MEKWHPWETFKENTTASQKEHGSSTQDVWDFCDGLELLQDDLMQPWILPFTRKMSAHQFSPEAQAHLGYTEGQRS